MDSYFQSYLPVAVYGGLVFFTGAFLLLVPRLLGPRRRRPHHHPHPSLISSLISSVVSQIQPTAQSSEKEAPYECGVPLLGSSRERFTVRFYLIAILFVLFDIETIFLIPWAVIYRNLGAYGVLEMLVFMTFLFLGFVYAWKRGGLDWE